MTRPLPQKLTGVYGFVPSSGFASTVNFFKNQVKKAGFTVIDFQVDDPHDSEGTYRGNGRVGRWQVRSMPACPQAMTIAVSAGSAK